MCLCLNLWSLNTHVITSGNDFRLLMTSDFFPAKIRNLAKFNTKFFLFFFSFDLVSHMRKKNINIHTYEFPSLIIFCLHSWLTCSNSAAFWIRHQTRQVVCYLWQGFQILSSQLTQKSLAMLNVVWCRPGLFACHHVSVERSIMKINLKDDHRNGCLCFFGFYLLCCDSVLPVYLFPNHWLFFFHFQ